LSGRHVELNGRKEEKRKKRRRREKKKKEEKREEKRESGRGRKDKRFSFCTTTNTLSYWGDARVRGKHAPAHLARTPDASPKWLAEE